MTVGEHDLAKAAMLRRKGDSCRDASNKAFEDREFKLADAQMILMLSYYNEAYEIENPDEAPIK